MSACVIRTQPSMSVPETFLSVILAAEVPESIRADLNLLLEGISLSALD
jgi:hypothetical protein